MSLTTSRGDATVGQLCEAFGISRQAYYAARKAPARRPEVRRRPERRGPWVSDATLTGAQQVQVAGVRIAPGVTYAQLVGATVNKANAFPEPGAAVYTVLSGSFDRLPTLAP